LERRFSTELGKTIKNQYTHLDSIPPTKTQGKSDSKGSVIPSVIPFDVVELIELWPILDDDGKAQVLRMARALASDRSERGADT